MATHIKGHQKLLHMAYPVNGVPGSRTKAADHLNGKVISCGALGHVVWPTMTSLSSAQCYIPEPVKADYPQSGFYAGVFTALGSQAALILAPGDLLACE